MADEYSFADQLKSEFRGRGAAVSGMQASSTSELMHRAEMGMDPDGNVAEEAFRENYRARQSYARTAPSRPPIGSYTVGTGAPSPYGYTDGPQSFRAGYGPGNEGMRTPRTDGASRPNYPGPDAAAQRMRTRENEARRRAEEDRISEDIAGRGHAARGERSAAGTSPSGRPGNAPGRNAERKQPQIRVTRTRAAKKRMAAETAYGGAEEIEVRRSAFPVALIALCLIAAAIIFFIVESFAQVYQTSNEIARMKAELEARKEVAAGMELKLDEKNDIRTIRSIAADELGMAEEDSMQRRFVSVSGGERIEVLEEENEEESPGGVLLSSISESFSRFRDRFR